MTITPDPKTVREIVLEYLRRYVTSIDHGDVVDEMLTDERFAHLMTGDEDQDIAMLDPIATDITEQAKALAGTLSWPDEQPQDERDARAAVASPAALVAEFHAAFDLPRADRPVLILDTRISDARQRLLENAQTRQISTEGRLNTRYFVEGRPAEVTLAAVIDTLIVDAARLGIRFTGTVTDKPVLYYDGDGENGDWPPPEGWKHMLRMQADRIGWDSYRVDVETA